MICVQWLLYLCTMVIFICVQWCCYLCEMGFSFVCNGDFNLCAMVIFICVQWAFVFVCNEVDIWGCTPPRNSASMAST